MTKQLYRTPLSEGISLSVLRDPKFKYNRLSVHLVTPLCPGTVTENAVLPLLLRRGCESYPDFTELSRRLDGLYGSSLSAEVGKSGANQLITLAISSIDDRYTLDDDGLTRQCAELLRDIVLSPSLVNGLFPAEGIALERQNLIDAIEAEINDKRSYSVARCRTLMGRGDPASLRKYGTVKDAEAITAERATARYHALLRDAVIEVMSVGPTDATAAQQILSDAFAALPRAPQPVAFPRIVPRCDSVSEHTEQLDVAQAKLVMGFRTGERGDAQHQAVLRVLAALYGGTPFSRLFVNVREKLSLCYYCAARYDRNTAVLMVDSGVERQNADRAREEILRQLDCIRQGDFDDETLDNTKLLIANALRAVSDSSGAIEDWYVGRMLSGEVVSPEEELSIVESVTREQVIAAAAGITLDTVYLLTGKEGQ